MIFRRCTVSEPNKRFLFFRMFRIHPNDVSDLSLRRGRKVPGCQANSLVVAKCASRRCKSFCITSISIRCSLIRLLRSSDCGASTRTLFCAHPLIPSTDVQSRSMPFPFTNFRCHYNADLATSPPVENHDNVWLVDGLRPHRRRLGQHRYQ